jgi:molecular chaperone GrpE (heat shock protein)
MSEANISDKIARPEIIVRALIKNLDNKYLLVDTVESKGKYVCPGGHVEWGESLEDALKREIKEEVGLDINKIQFINYSEFILSKNYLTDKHALSLRFSADCEQNDVIIDKKEITGYIWLELEEILQSGKVHPGIKDAFQSLKDRQAGKHKWFGKRCADCEKYKAEADEFKSGWQRALADYKNLQNEITARRSEWAQMSERQILDEFIPVYENFKTAFYHHPELDETDEKHKLFKNWIDGIGYIRKQFAEIFKQHNIEEIITVGEKFDPNLHEAVGEETVPDREAGMILREVSGGYLMGGKVIRPAKVVVSK